MNPLELTFQRLRKNKRKALIPFVMAGDPNLSVTRAVLPALAEAGADVIEVGIPFSDPLADGPVIQAASMRALRAGTTPRSVLALLRRLRSRLLQVPVICLSYWNPILQFGVAASDPKPDAFLAACASSGVSGLVVPDLPVEEGRSFAAAAARHRISPIFLAAPTSPTARLRMIARTSRGFIYAVSVTGTTGMRRDLPVALAGGVRALRRVTKMPICVGFGITTPQQAHEVARLADGVIVGSALVRRLFEAGSRDAACQAHLFVRRLRAGLDG
jgi:tryptophan synthase alpha chain